MYMWTSFFGFSASKKSSWAVARLAPMSSIAPVMKITRSFNRREKMSYCRSPRAVCSSTYGMNVLMEASRGSAIAVQTFRSLVEPGLLRANARVNLTHIEPIASMHHSLQDVIETRLLIGAGFRRIKTAGQPIVCFGWKADTLWPSLARYLPTAQTRRQFEPLGGANDSKSIYVRGSLRPRARDL